MSSYNTLTDQELIGLLNTGDEAAFTEIFNRYNKLLYSHVYNKLRDADQSRDLVQDVFVGLWEKRLSVQDINLAGYLFISVRNRILNLISHQKIVTDYTEFLFKYKKEAESVTDHLVRERQLTAIIETEIAALPPRMREIFELSRRAHLTNKQIASSLNISEHTVADQIKKSLRILRFRIGLVVFITSLINW